MPRVTAADILKVIPITRKTLWLWQKKYNFFPDPVKKAHPGGKGIVGYYPAWVKERCISIFNLQKKGYTVQMIKEVLKKEKNFKSTKKILIVDGEKKFTDSLEKFFAKNEFLVEVAHDGLDAGLKAAIFMPSIILFDINLPGLKGEEICHRFKENSKTECTRIIAIYNNSDLKSSEKKILDAGAEACLKKPINMELLLEQCTKLVIKP